VGRSAHSTSDVGEDYGEGWSRPSDSDLSEGLSFCLCTLHVAKMLVALTVHSLDQQV
jgi:hypothetical protein